MLWKYIALSYSLKTSIINSRWHNEIHNKTYRNHQGPLLLTWFSKRGRIKLKSAQYSLPNFIRHELSCISIYVFSYIWKMLKFIHYELFNNLSLFKYSGKHVYIQSYCRRSQWVIGTWVFRFRIVHVVFPICIRVTLFGTEPTMSDCPSLGQITLENMGKYVIQIHLKLSI